MSLRYTCRLYPTTDSIAFRRAIDEVAKLFGGHIEWGQVGSRDECLRLGTTPTVQSLYLRYGACDWRFFGVLSEKVNAPFMELRIQEGALWDYSLHNGTDCLDTFSTLPQYWDPDLDEDEANSWAGNPKLVAGLWQVPVDRIERYFVNWGLLDKKGLRRKAYPTDENTYGECRQMFDFLAALGAADALEDHRLVLPQQRT